MPLTIEILPDPAANARRLTQLVSERSSPLERLNILHGSGLQRLATQRMLAEANGGALAGIYGFTPVDLAAAAARLGESPHRNAWPAGADLSAVQQVARNVPLNSLDPDAPGVPSALLRSLTDLREAALSPDDLPNGDLRTIFSAWQEHTSNVADRTSRYEDAISPATPTSAFAEALGHRPLIVSDIYDLTRIQRLLLARLADAIDVRMLLVAPTDDPSAPPHRTVAALRRDINVRVVRSQLTPEPLAPDHYFSVGDPTAEADAISARILQLARQGTAFHDIAILHQQGAPSDDRICAALDRAGIPSWRIGGRQLADTPIGQAATSLVHILLSPDSVDRTTLFDWLSHRSLRERPLGIARRPAHWERIALDAGLAEGLAAMQHRLSGWNDLDADDATDLAEIIHDLCQRARELDDATSWRAAADMLIDALDTYLDDGLADHDVHPALNDTLAMLSAHDTFGSAWSPAGALTSLNRAVRSRVVRDSARLIGGVNIGAASGPARSIRYDAIFVAGVAERVFPAIGREDPLLTDRDRAAINSRIPDALALQGERGHSDRHAWSLARRSAKRQFSASWSRRSSAVGGPSRPSILILESAHPDPEPPAATPQGRTLLSESTLAEQGRIERIDSAVVTPSLSAADVSAEDWSRVLEASDAHSFDLALIAAPGVDYQLALANAWPLADASKEARLQRNASQFTVYDGYLNDAVATDQWRPLERVWSAAALETFVRCPYRFYLRYIVGAEATLESDRPDQSQRQIAGTLIRRVLAKWALEFLDASTSNNSDTWLQYVEQSHHLSAVAGPILDAAENIGGLGPPAVSPPMRNDILEDLDRCRRREVINARDRWTPLDVSISVDDASLRLARGRKLRLRGDMDRIDIDTNGNQRAILFSIESTLPDVHGFVNGSSFQSVAALAGLNQRGIKIHQAEVEHRSITRAGHFESQTLKGTSLTSTGGPAAPRDGERLRDTLSIIASHLESANFVPYPGHPLRDRPNCQRCPYESCCTADIGRRYEHKVRKDPDVIRQLEQLRRQQV